MRNRMNNEAELDGGLSGFFWNLVGGVMVSALLSGVVYGLAGVAGTYLFDSGQLWNLSYVKWYFIALLTIYLLTPTLLANTVGFVFGVKSKASGTKPKD